MNSPIICLWDPIQSMKINLQKVNSILKKNGKKQKKASPPKNKTKTSVAAAYAGLQLTSEPRFTRQKYNSVRIVHRELVASITGTSTFSVLPTNSFPLNPGMAVTFPWLSNQAVSWEQYKFHKLKFCYYSRCSTTTAGSVFLIPDYDAADQAPYTEQIASTYRGTVENAPWVPEFSCTLDPSSLNGPLNRRFVRNSPLNLADQRVSDAGDFFVGTNDGTATPWGKLWVEYDVELFNPQQPPGGDLSIGFEHLNSQTWSSSNKFSSVVIGANNTTYFVTDSTNWNRLICQVPGNYMITCYMYALGGTIAPTFTIFTGFTFNPNFGSPPGSELLINQSGLIGYLFSGTFIAGGTMIFNDVLSAGSPSRIEVTISPIPINAT